jgi:hypothetical protein
VKENKEKKIIIIFKSMEINSTLKSWTSEGPEHFNLFLGSLGDKKENQTKKEFFVKECARFC